MRVAVLGHQEVALHEDALRLLVLDALQFKPRVSFRQREQSRRDPFLVVRFVLLRVCVRRQAREEYDSVEQASRLGDGWQAEIPRWIL